MRRIAVINQKGGVGKTTTAANLGAALALRGKRVVVVDLDPQANLTVHLGADVADGGPSMYGVLLGETAFGDVLRPTSTPNLLLAPASLDLAGAEVELASAIGRELRLREAVDEWATKPVEPSAVGARGAGADFLLVDCPPSLGLLSVNGLVAASEVFIAAQTEFFALRGLSKLMELVDLVKRKLNPSLELTGIVATLYDSRRNLAREVLEELRSFFGPKVFRTAIRENVRLAEAPSHGKSIFDYAPESHGAEDYRAFAGEVLGETMPEPVAETAPVPTSAPPAKPVDVPPAEPAQEASRAEASAG